MLHPRPISDARTRPVSQRASHQLVKRGVVTEACLDDCKKTLPCSQRGANTDDCKQTLTCSQRDANTDECKQTCSQRDANTEGYAVWTRSIAAV